jgi:ribosomal protein L11 methyltransferase
VPRKINETDVNSALATQRWLCLSLAVPHEAAEVVASILTELGSLGVVEGIRDFQRPDTGATEVQGFFPEETSSAELSLTLIQSLTNLADLFPTLGSVTPRFAIVASDAWMDRWRDHFPPLAVGERFLVLPPWLPIPAENQRIPLIIDPSMAFGTGHHATTQGCLEAIEFLHRACGSPERALDLGTGAGILAIALVKLGAANVFATDIDPVALDEARKNSQVNQATSCIHFSDLSLEQLPTPFALLVANLFSSTLVALAQSLRAGVERTGHAILSGIQLDQEHDVLTAYAVPDWRLIKRFPQDEWVTLVLQRT